MKHMKIPVLLIFALLLSVGLFAQRGRGNQKHYKFNKHNNYNRNYISVNAGPRYGYNYQYRPSYRPVPVYRTNIRPVYRSSRTYVHFGPAFGLRLNVLPFGYNRVFVGSNPYYYNDGVYYRSYQNGGYEVVAPPLDATVVRLPANAIVTIVDGQKYYQVGGTFYQEEIIGNNKLQYRVVGTDGVLNTGSDEGEYEDMNAVDEVIPALGSRYNTLPVDSKVQVINQQKYFVAPNGIYYKEVIEGNNVRYEVTTVQ